MNWREKLADWLSGGRITAMQDKLITNIALRDNAMEDRGKYRDALERCGQALHAIASCETPSANATVKRMARIAREALK